MNFKILYSILTFLIAAAGLVLFTLSSGSNNGMNLIFLGVMIIMILFFVINFFTKAGKLKNDLNHAENEIKESLFNLDNQLFEMPVLQEAFENYMTEMKRLKTDSDFFVSCDIADYVNSNCINRTIHKSLCESVPGALTGLGILGTFLGLIFGLRNFNLGADYETMQTSIALLINGIKTAFLTSIYGVVFSILFNFLYRFVYQDAINAMNQFHDAFYRYAVPNSQNEMSRNLVKAQEIQIQNQNKTLENILKHYVTSFNDVCGEQLKMLKNTLEAVNDSQKENIKVMNKTIKSICNREMALSENTKQLSNFSEVLETYMKNISGYQEQITESHHALLEEVNKSSSVTRDIINVTEKVGDSLSSFTTLMTKQMQDIMNQFEILQYDYHNTISDFTIEMNKSITGLMQMIQSAQKNNEQQNTDLQKNYQETLQTIQKTSEDAAVMINEMTVMQENQKNYLQLLYQDTSDVTRNFQESSVAVQKSASELIENYQQVVAGLSEKTMQVLNRFDNTASDLVNNYQGLFVGLSENSVSALETFEETVSDVSNEFYETLERLQDISEKFPEAMEASQNSLRTLVDKIQNIQQSLMSEKTKEISETAEEE